MDLNMFFNKSKKNNVKYPCVSLGEKVFIPRIDGTIDEEKITNIEYNLDHWTISSYTKRCIYERDIGTKIFKTQAEAEEFLKTQKLKKLKKKKLKEFEKTLNEELGLDTYIIR